MKAAAPRADRASRTATQFTCQSCGYISTRWIGRCPECNEWNTFLEETVSSPKSTLSSKDGPRAFLPKSITTSSPIEISKAETAITARSKTGIPEFDRVLGGGVVPGSVVLIGGDPGIGKSTLMLQMAASLANPEQPFLYVSGEESPSQIRLRASRLKAIVPGLQILCETNLNEIEGHVNDITPSGVIVDSIQTIFREDLASAPGSASQLRECGAYLVRLAKSIGIPFFIVGHVTKEGTIAGPKILEHMVDTVLYFEGDSSAEYRILRALKNRFGSVNEVGLFEMGEGGLLSLDNPSRLLLEERPADTSGSVVTVTMEGTRPLLVEIQALATPSALSNPRRTSNGFEFNRLLMLLAVLEGRAGVKFSDKDVYVNVAGGFRITEPAADLAVALALLSCHKNKPVPADLAAFGEVGLGGEIRRVASSESRLSEAARLGFTSVLAPRDVAANGASKKSALKIERMTHISQALNLFSKK